MPMNNDRPSFLIYKDSFEVLQELSDEDLGKVFRMIFEYTIHGIIPDKKDKNYIAFSFLKLNLDRDNKKYLDIIERNKINGSKGGRPKKPKKPSGLNGNPSKPKKADIDIDTDIVIERDIDIDIKTKHSFCKSPYFEFSKFEEAFLQTKCYSRYPNLSIEAIHEELMLASDSNSKYKYNNWLSVAQNWVNRNPAKYQNTIKKSIEQDPISPLMNKGDKIRAENDARLEAQLKLLAHEDPYSKYH